MVRVANLARSVFVSRGKYVGMDLQATSSVAVTDADGKLIMKFFLEANPAAMVEFIPGLHRTPWLTAASLGHYSKFI